MEHSFTSVCKTILLCLLVLVFSAARPADVMAGTKVARALAPRGASGNTGSNTILPDLFTGTMTHSVPIETAPGRGGMTPQLALTYLSSGGNSIVGMGWALGGVGAINRSAKNGINYSGDDFQYVASTTTSDLVDIGNGEYSYQIEGELSRIRKLVASDNRPYWEITDKSGRRFLYGQSSSSRLDDPANPDRIYKWCLDYVIDPNGNYWQCTYIKDQGQIYLAEIDYSLSTNGPTSYMKIKLTMEVRPDPVESYVSNFEVITAYRLQQIDIISSTSGDDKLFKRYQLIYGAIGNHSVLSTIKRFGSDGVSSLPDIQLGWQKEADGFVSSTAITGAYGNWDGNPDRIHPMDVNGDGKQDIVIGPDSQGKWYVLISNGTTFVDKGAWITGAYGNWDGNSSRIRAMDVDGDGLQDIVIGPDSGGNWYVLKSTGTSFVNEGAWITGAYGNWDGDASRIRAMDVDGDGLQDIVLGPDSGGNWFVLKSTGTSFVNKGTWISGAYGSWSGSSSRMRVMDVNGDGLPDIVVGPDSSGTWYVLESTGYSFIDKGAWATGAYGNWSSNVDRIRAMDVNGDGLQDIVIGPDSGGNWYVLASTGTSFINRGAWISGAYGNWDGNASRIRAMDVDGDGLQDIVIGPDSGGNWYVLSSTGTSFVNKGAWISGAYGNWDGNASRIRPMYLTGDGRDDIVIGPDSGGSWYLLRPDNQVSLLSTISNGLNGTTTVHYTPSPAYSNTSLPFTIQTVSSIHTDDGNGNVGITSFSYSGGYYYRPDKEFRGFKYAKLVGPAGLTGEQRVTETWFHQGNGTSASADDPSVPVGYMKGRAYHELITDATGGKYSETTTTFSSDNDGMAPYFNPPQQVDRYAYDGSDGTGYVQTRTVYTYDDYGNVAREDHYGDVNDPSDDITIIRTFKPNAEAWITSLSTSEAVYKGIGTDTLVSRSDYYYDDLTDCSAAPTNNQTPTLGNLTRTVRWLNGGINPEIWKAYDGYGNIACTRDANGNISTITYDTSKTFPVASTNPLNYVITTKYYGVDGVAADKGLYGQVKSVTDPNGGVTSYEYDVFGRQSFIMQADGFSKKTQYLNSGTVGLQRVRVDNSLGQWSEAYLDGLGRTFKTRQNGPENKVVAYTTLYDARGAVAKTSFPYFEGLETPRYKVNIYDGLGRLTQSYNGAEKSTSTVQTCYGLGVQVSLDANNHRRRETRDVMGRIVKIEEYTGTYTTCSADPLTPYATTKYTYDVLGNMVLLSDTKNNIIQMGYDSLGRKVSLSDPDMGNWFYSYDANDNLVSQTDAKSQNIKFQYDVLNRPIYKVYPDNSYVSYVYDESFSTHPKGRMTTMTDASGTSKYYYDVLGRSSAVVKTIDGTNYTLQSEYDGLGRIKSLQYPDGDVVSYTYNTDGTLYKVGSYATYLGYNALGQKGSIAFGNGVTTTFQFYPNNNRLYSETINGQSQGLLNIAYNYDNVGNVTGIVDYVPASTRGQSFSYDELNRLKTANGAYGALNYSYDEIGNLLAKEGVSLCYNSGRPHAVTSTTSGRNYNYDANGNVIFDGMRSLTYNYDNLPVGYNNGTVTFTYDGAGTRVKKTGANGSRIYVGKFYECVDGICGKYIFAGDERVAIKTPTETRYYHLDHLGSTTVVSDATGNKIEDVTYYPFGKTSRDIGSVSSVHKYTSQELDDETSLYNYGARWYDPEIGKFLSPDTIVPSPTDPQSLNRYAYVLNNPLLYTDPTGHSFWKHLFSIDPLTSWATDRASSMLMSKEPRWLADIHRGVQNSFSNILGPGQATEKGGVLGALSWTTGGAVTYSYGDGWGAHVSGNYYCLFGGVDWEEHGYSKGVTLTAGIGAQYDGVTAGYAASYNVTRGGRIHSTLLVGYGNNAGYGGISYSLDSGRFSGSANISFGAILKENLSLPTSTSGRYQTITSYANDPDAVHVTGIEGGGGIGGESSSLMIFLDTNMTHAIAVVHDYMMNSFNVSASNVAANIGLMLPAAIIGRAIGGPVHLGPYSINEL